MDKSETRVKLFDLLEALDAAEQPQKEHTQVSIVALSHILPPDSIYCFCLSYFQRYRKVADQHYTSIFQAMEKVLRSQTEAISPSTAAKVIFVALRKMGGAANVPPDTRQAASDVLVALGCSFPGEVIESMESVLQGDGQADPMWLNTLARLSRANVCGMVPRLRAILDYVMPALAQARSDEVKLAFCSVLTSFSRSIVEYTSGPGGSAYPLVKTEDFAAAMESAFRTVFMFWRAPQLREPVVDALVAMAPLLPLEAIHANMPQLISATLALYKDGTCGDALGKGVYQIVVLALESGYTLHDVSIDGFLDILHQEIRSCQESRLAVEEHSEVLGSVTFLANAFPLHVARFIAGQLKSSSAANRTTVLLILTHLLSAAAGQHEREDPQHFFSQSSCSSLCSILGTGAFELKEQVHEILGALQPCLPLLTEMQLRLPISLASLHPEQAAETLLSWTLPPDSSCCALWRALGAEGHLSCRLLRILMGKLSTSLHRDPAEDCVSTARQTLAVTCAVRELLAIPEGAGAFQRVFPQLLGALLLHTGCNEEISDLPGTGSVCRETVLAVKALLVQAQLGMVIEQLDQEAAWVKLQSPESHAEGIRLLARAMAQHAGPLLPSIVEVLVPFLSADREQTRVTVMPFFSELLGSSEQQLRAMLMEILTGRAQDPSVCVRLQLFQGVGRATGAQVEEHGRELLALLSSGLQDADVADRQAVLGALSALSQILPHLRQDGIDRDVVADICQRVTVLLESDDAELRYSGAAMIRELCQCQAVTAHIRHHLQGAMVRLALHLRDPNPEVSQACIRSLIQSESVLKRDTFRRLISQNQDKGEWKYNHLLDDLAAFLVSDFPEALGRFFSSAVDCLSSQLPQVRASAAIFIGFLFKNTPGTLLGSLQMDKTLQGLKLALQEETNAEARRYILQALGYGTVSQDSRQKPWWKRLF